MLSISSIGISGSPCIEKSLAEDSQKSYKLCRSPLQNSMPDFVSDFNREDYSTSWELRMQLMELEVAGQTYDSRIQLAHWVNHSPMKQKICKNKNLNVFKESRHTGNNFMNTESI